MSKKKKKRKANSHHTTEMLRSADCEQSSEQGSSASGKKKKKKTNSTVSQHNSTKKNVSKKTQGKKKSSGKVQKKRKKNSLFPQQGDNPFEVLRKTIFLMSATVFVVCIGLIGKYFWDNYQNELRNQEWADVYQNSGKIEDAENETEEPVDNRKTYFYLSGSSALLEFNPDIVGFIEIKDLKGEEKPEIRYPVLQYKPEDHNAPESEGNEYYLKRNLDGELEKAGSIFLDYRNYFDYVHVEKKTRNDHGKLVSVYGEMEKNSDNLIIYGHNMHDYSMFGSLKRYINEADYYDNHPIVNLNSNFFQYQYKIFGMIIVDVDDETETAFDYWNTLNFNNEEEFYDYVNEIKRRTVRLTDVDVKYGDQLLTLSTCNSTFSEGRLVVFARLLRDDEELLEGCTSEANPNIKWPNSYYKWHKKTYDPDAEFEPYG